MEEYLEGKKRARGRGTDDQRAHVFAFVCVCVPLKEIVGGDRASFSGVLI